MKFKKFELLDISNDDYHAQRDAAEHFYSSSQLKAMLEDPEIFYKKYITGEIERKSIPAFDIGTYFHTAILEPELLEKECAVYSGQRRGKAWEEFKTEHAGKAIITTSEHDKAMHLINGFKASALSEGIYSGGQVELSLFVEYWVAQGNIYLILPGRSELYMLDVNGWIRVDTIPAPATRIKVKVRGDYIHEEAGHLADLKSTTGNPKDARAIKDKIRGYSYDMSASLYLDAFNAYTLNESGESKFKDFYWSFATKDNPMCQHYNCTDKMFSLGRAKYKKALLELAKYQENGWEFVEEIISLDPAPFEDEWLQKPEVKERKTIINIKPDLGEDLL